jgi:hypothetical protein
LDSVSYASLIIRFPILAFSDGHKSVMTGAELMRGGVIVGGILKILGI